MTGSALQDQNGDGNRPPVSGFGPVFRHNKPAVPNGAVRRDFEGAIRGFEAREWKIVREGGQAANGQPENGGEKSRGKASPPAAGHHLILR
jgi:hypothetical protein